MRELVDRMRALEHRVQDATAARREEFRSGVAYFNDRLSSVWDLNFARLDRACDDPAGQVERVQSALSHRKVLIEEPELVARLGPALRERGYGERKLVALARGPGGRLDPAVRELRCADIEELRREITRERLTPPDPAVIDQLVAAGALTEKAGGRWLACFEHTRAVAHCVVFSHGGLAQVEDVATLDAFQGRGIARRLLEHVLEWARGDHDAVFIQAEAEDWPLGFYERLGFERVEERADYLLIVAGST